VYVLSLRSLEQASSLSFEIACYGEQGDQIGVILGDHLRWAIFYFKITKEAQIFVSAKFHRKSCALILTKHGLGFIFGDFFQNLIWSP
jgi:hypothetical protein